MRRRGFSLLELLIAMMLAAMLLVLVAGVWQTTLNTRDRLVLETRRMSEERRAYELIARDLHSATLPPDDSGLQFGTSTTTAAVGSDVLQFASVVGEPLMAGRIANGTTLVQYAVLEDPETGEPGFFRFETPYPIPEGSVLGEGEDTRAIRLLSGVQAATYQFYSTAQETWVPTWEGEPGLPTAIRIELAVFDPLPPGEVRPADAEPRLIAWMVSLPAAQYANDEAAAAAEAEAAASGGGTTP